MVVFCGIDEAGRGPVIGPLVMVALVADENSLLRLSQMGVRDSKALTPQQRYQLFDKLHSEKFNYEFISLSPAIIDNHLKQSTSNLNKLEAKTSAELINRLNPDEVYIDLPDRNAVKYANYISKYLDHKVKLTLEHKADEKYPIVSAASIIAKVLRDKYIEDLKRKVGQDFGTGYTSDERTITFLEKNWDKYDIFRKTWITWKNVENKHAQKQIFDY